MAITIINSSGDYDLNKFKSGLVRQNIIVDSTNKGLTNFRYVYRVTIQSTKLLAGLQTDYIGEFQVRPQGANSYGYFDISEIAKNCFRESDFLNGFKNSTSDICITDDHSPIVYFSIELLEFDGVNVSAVLATKTGYLYNGYPIVSDYLNNGILDTIAANQDTFAMTKYNGVFKKLYVSETSATLIPVWNIYNSSGFAVSTNISVEPTNSDGVVTGSAVTTAFKYRPDKGIEYIGGSAGNRLARFTSGGTGNLNSSYKLSHNYSGNPSQSVYAIESCKPFIELYFKNRLGAFEQFIFTHYRQSNNLEKVNFKQMDSTAKFIDNMASFSINGNGFVAYKQNSEGVKQYSTTVTPTFEVAKSIIDFNEYNAFIEFMQSNEIYLAVPILNNPVSDPLVYTHKYIPIVVNNNSVGVWKPNQDKATVAKCTISLPSFKTQSN
jgi:hypothetical protein